LTACRRKPATDPFYRHKLFDDEISVSRVSNKSTLSSLEKSLANFREIAANKKENGRSSIRPTKAFHVFDK